MAQELTIQLLKQFSPLDALKRENLAALCKKTEIRSASPGQMLFKEGDKDQRTYFLLSGSVEARGSESDVETISAGSSESRTPLWPGQPRKVSVRVTAEAQYISIDSDLLDVMLTWDQTGQYEVGELRQAEQPETEDWMTTLLANRAFHKIPPANIQAIFMRMQQINYKAGDVIIKQGDEGDYFYVITRGTASVTRETPLSKDGIKLAELGVGETFGEEALISSNTRNATVTMATDGSLMRLGKDDFNTLLNEPMLEWVDYEQAKEVVAEGGKWLDVRLPSEYDSFHESGAINIPLYFIRLKISTLDPDTTYVVVCDTGRRSSAAAYILSERGFDTRVVKGGLNTSDS